MARWLERASEWRRTQNALIPVCLSILKLSIFFLKIKKSRKKYHKALCVRAQCRRHDKMEQMHSDDGVPRVFFLSSFQIIYPVSIPFLPTLHTPSSRAWSLARSFLFLTHNFFPISSVCKMQWDRTKWTHPWDIISDLRIYTPFIPFHSILNHQSIELNWMRKMNIFKQNS